MIFVLCEYDSTGKHDVKGCDSNFEVHVYIFKMLKVVRNETTTLHLTICTWTKRLTIIKLMTNNLTDMICHKVQPYHLI